MCKRRSFGTDGSNHACNEFIHYRKRFGFNVTGLVDFQRILHVRISSIRVGTSNIARTSTVGQLMYGRLSDIWSRKIILLMGLAIFFIGSLASSLAESVLQLTIFRAITGIGGGGLMTVAQLIVSDVVPLRERGKYQGILVSFKCAAVDNAVN
jgi:MFS family permease